MDTATMLQGLAETLDLAELSPNGDGVCRLIFDERMTVDIEIDEIVERVRLYSVVSSLAAEPSAAVYETLLRANLSETDGRGNYFGIDADARELVLFSHLDTRLIDRQEFEHRLESFVDDLEHWLDRYANGELDAPEPGTGRPASGEATGDVGSMALRL